MFRKRWSIRDSWGHGPLYRSSEVISTLITVSVRWFSGLFRRIQGRSCTWGLTCVRSHIRTRGPFYTTSSGQGAGNSPKPHGLCLREAAQATRAPVLRATVGPGPRAPGPSLPSCPRRGPEVVGLPPVPSLGLPSHNGVPFPTLQLSPSSAHCFLATQGLDCCYFEADGQV